MRYRNAACALYVSCIAVSVSAQAPGQSPAAEAELVPPPAWAFNDLACAPSLDMAKNDKAEVPAQRVIGSQDTVIRELLGLGDTLVISGGSNAGLQPGDRYFLRRRLITRGGTPPVPATIHTAGWIQILGVDATLATATVLHACEGILLDDYLEPFVAPTIAANPLPGSTPHYEQMGHIMTGVEGLQMAGAGQLMTIDRGSNGGVVAGQRFLVFRDKRKHRVETTGRSGRFQEMEGTLPLVEIGQVLVVAVRPNDSTVQVVISKDAVITGDLVAPIR